MAKIPVTKTVVRNGQTHTQTYWEEDDKHSSQSSRLAGLGVSLPKQQKYRHFPEDAKLESNWESYGDGFSAEDMEAAISAGLTVRAAMCMIASLTEGRSLSGYIYENGLDEQPRPQGGWDNKDGTSGHDQRSSWDGSGISLETAIQWIDAGFPSPTGGIPELIQAGVSVDRAQQWNAHLSKKRRGDLASAHEELTSDITIEEAIEYRKALKGNATEPLTSNDLRFHDKGVLPADAGRWAKASHDDVTVDQIARLDAANWSPGNAKAMAQVLYGDKFTKFDWRTAEFILDATTKVGDAKTVADWLPTLKAANGSKDLFDDLNVRRIHRAEEFKKKAFDETGYRINKDANTQLWEASGPQRDAYLKIMKSSFRDNADSDNVRHTLKLAAFIGSEENVKVLEDNGYLFGNPETNKPYTLSFSDNSYENFDASTADEGTRNSWMRDVALRLYSNPVRNQDQRYRWISDETVNPVQFKDILMSNSDASDDRLEAIFDAKTSSISDPVVEGWL